MAFFEVHLPPADKFYAEREANARFVRQGLSLFALAIPPIWLIWNRLWFYLALYLVFAAVLYGLGLTRWSTAVVAISFLPGLYLFLEGRNLVSAELERGGWEMAGLVEASDMEDAEYRWFSDHARKTSVPSVALSAFPVPPKPVTAPIQDRPDFGLFAED